MSEQQVIEQLSRYRDIEGRLKVLETYHIGCGFTVSRLNADDQLQELHKRLRGLPTCIYLSPKEQQIESTAHAYLKSYPAGTRSQLRAVKDCEGVDEEDRKLLKVLQRKIAKVIEARTGQREGYEEILEQLAEYQDLTAEKQRIDDILAIIKDQKPQYEELLRLHYIEGLTWSKVIDRMPISKSVFYRMRTASVSKYAQLAGWEKCGKNEGKNREQTAK